MTTNDEQLTTNDEQRYTLTLSLTADEIRTLADITYFDETIPDAMERAPLSDDKRGRIDDVPHVLALLRVACQRAFNAPNGRLAKIDMLDCEECREHPERLGSVEPAHCASCGTVYGSREGSRERLALRAIADMEPGVNPAHALALARTVARIALDRR